MTKKPSPWDQDQTADPSKLDLSFLPQNAEEIKARLEEAQKEDDAYNRDLQKRAKTFEQLTVGLECVVESVNFYQVTGHATSGEVRYDGPALPSYKTGHFLRTELSVKSDSLVQKLGFNGWPHLEVGDIITAYIMKGKEETEKHFGSFRNDPFNQGPKTHLVDRQYNTVEQPSKIEKLRDGKVVATYHNS